MAIAVIVTGGTPKSSLVSSTEPYLYSWTLIPEVSKVAVAGVREVHALSRGVSGDEMPHCRNRRDETVAAEHRQEVLPHGTILAKNDATSEGRGYPSVRHADKSRHFGVRQARGKGLTPPTLEQGMRIKNRPTGIGEEW